MGLGSGSGGDSDSTIVEPGGALITASGITLSTEKITATGGTLNISTNGPVNITGPAILSGTYGGMISGSANFTAGASLNLNGTNSFTGTLAIPTGAVVTVNSSSGLGSAGAPVVVSGGRLNVKAAVPNTLTLQSGNLGVSGAIGGIVNIYSGSATVGGSDTATFNVSGGMLLLAGQVGLVNVSGTGDVNVNDAESSPISVTGGTVSLGNFTGSYSGPITVANAVLNMTAQDTLAHPVSFFGSSTITGNGITFPAASFTSAGILTTGGQVVFANSVSLTGTLIQNGTAQFTSIGSTASLIFNGSTSVSSSLVSSKSLSIWGFVNAAGSFNAAQIVMGGGELSGNGTISSPSPLEVSGGTLGFTGSDLAAGGIDIATATSADLVSFPSNGSINVLSGVLNVHPVVATSGVALDVPGSAASLNFLGGSISNPINFSSVTGYSGPAMVVGSATTLNGPISIPLGGITLAGASTATFSGPISGGPLTLDASATITGINNTLGGLNLGPNVTLDLKGALQLSGPVNLGPGSIMLIDNLSGIRNDRITGSPSIIMDGGWLDLEAPSGQSVFESLGTLTLDSGYSRITAHDSGNNATVTITVAGIVENPGAVLDLEPGRDVSGATLAFGTGGNGPYLFIQNQAATNFLGGSFLYTSSNFLKYSTSTGVTPLAPSDYFTGPEPAWQEGLIPSTPPDSSLTLTGSRSVTALSLGMPTGQAELTGDTLNLAGFSLNVVQGGLLMGYYTNITGSAGNRLTAGGQSSSATLYFRSIGSNNFGSPTITVSANITDNPGPDGQYDPTPGGPLDADNGQVSVVFSDYNYYLLSGTNTYTGTTYLAGPSTTIAYASSAAVSPGPLSVAQGNVIANGVAVHVGPITLIGGSLTGPGSFNAPSYAIQSGVISATILGNGPLTKTSSGSATVTLTPSFTGAINAMGGTLSISSGTLTNSLTIQNGAVVGPGAQLAVLGPVTMGDNSILQVYNVFYQFGASLNFAPSSLTVGNNAYLSFGGDWIVGGSSDPFTDSSDPSRHLNVSVFPPNISGGGGFAALEISAGNKNVGAVSAGLYAVTVDNGASLTADSVLAGGLNVNGTFVLRSTGAGENQLQGLNIAGTMNSWSGVVDVTDRQMMVEVSSNRAAAIAQLQNQIREGRNGGAWTGLGITSSTAAANPSQYSVGIFDNSILGVSAYAGGNPDVYSVLVGLAKNGDANDDGAVDMQDLQILGANWLKPATNWAQGDLNDDGIVNMQDLLIVEQNWNSSGSFEGAITSLEAQGEFPGVGPVPEPASLGLLFLGGLGLVLKRRSSRRPSRWR